MPYFSKFPRYVTTANSTTIIMTDLFRRTQFGSRFNDVSVALIPYLILDGETPEHVSQKMYGTPFYHWMILQINEIVNVYREWPTSEQIVMEKCKDRYDDVYDVHHYISLDSGAIVDFDYPVTKVPITNIEYEVQQNDQKRAIRVLDSRFLGQVVREFDTLINL